MNKKGFTLIELLAVIAILAIIMLIATPMVLSTISSAREDAAEQSAKLAWKAADLWLAEQALDGNALPATITYAQYSTKLSGGTVLDTSNNFDVTSGSVSGISTTTPTASSGLKVSSGGQTFTCTGTSVAAITCS